MAQEQRPRNITIEDSTLFINCQIVFMSYFIRICGQMGFWAEWGLRSFTRKKRILHKTADAKGAGSG